MATQPRRTYFHMTDSSARSEHSHTSWATVPPIEWQNKIMAQYFVVSPQGIERGRIAGEILRAFDGYLKSMARSIWRRYGGLKGCHGLRDLESAGREGLLIAMQKWHPDRSKPLIHLASIWIACACKVEARRQAMGAVDLPLKVRRLAKAYRSLRIEGEAGSAETLLLASRSRVRTRQIVRFLSQSASPSLSLAIPLPHETEMLPGDHSDDLEKSDAMASIRRCLIETCSPRDRLIF